MSKYNLENRGITDKRVLDAMETVPRERFVPEHLASQALGDFPLPIGCGQTISQPYMVAVMTQLLKLEPDHKVLEIGTGSGFQAAILAQIVKAVYSVEVVQELCDRAREVLGEMGYDNVRLRCEDGYRGWPEQAPFDGIIVTAAPPQVPEALVEQLAEDGRMVVPVGQAGNIQELMLVEKQRGQVEKRRVMSVAFVPMVRSD